MSIPPSDAPLALITGGARRLGAAIAARLVAAGCDVIITWHRSETEARALCSRLSVDGRRAAAERLDLSDLAAVQRFGARLAATLPRLDVVVHNAGDDRSTPIDALDPEAVTRVMQVGALGPLMLTGALAGPLRASALPGGGAVVCLGDIHAMGRPRAGMAAYSMAKAALGEMVRSLARDLAPARVNGVAPGVALWGDEPAAVREAYTRRVPLGRVGTPDEVAEAVRWLALDAHFVTGEMLRLDGGRWLR